MGEDPIDRVIRREQFWVGRAPWPAGVYRTGPTCRVGFAIWPHVDHQRILREQPHPLPVRPGDWILRYASGRVRVLTALEVE